MEVKPQLSVVPKSTLQVEDYAPMVAEAPSPPPIPPKECLTVWDINARFKFKIASATNISIETGTEVEVILVCMILSQSTYIQRRNSCYKTVRCFFGRHVLSKYLHMRRLERSPFSVNCACTC